MNPLHSAFRQTVGACVLATGAFLATPSLHADFQELKYNNDDLAVDLTVGLWAWPMPVDWDEDGDLDLLVSCPDKPSNGVFFFENASEGEKMPVFRKPVRVGDAKHNFQISYVDGEPRFLLPGHELPTPREDWSKREKIYPKTNIHRNSVRGNMWRYVDFEGDGDQDLIVGVGDWKQYGWDAAYDMDGNWRNNPLHGYVYLIRNEAGSGAEPDYAEPVKLKASGEIIDVFGWPSPNFADFDGDGDLDLLCGEFLDGFTYFENTGSREKPEYAAGQRLMYEGEEILMDLQMITPTAIDWDGDGDQDLIVGDEDGRVALVEHAGVQNGQPQFRPPVYFQQQADEINVGALATPFSYDWDSDGDEDLICGNTAGYVLFVENLTGGTEPSFAEPVRLEAGGEVLRILAGPSGSIQGIAEAKWGYTTLSVADWDGDELADIIINNIWGKILWYRNKGTKTEPSLEAGRPVQVDWEGEAQNLVWNWWEPEGNNLVTQWRTTPLATDWNEDGLMDLVLMDADGYLCVYERKRTEDGGLTLLPPTRSFVDENGEIFRLNTQSVGRSGRSKIAIVDWDSDGREDLLVNSSNADWYRNLGTTESGHTILKKVGTLGERNLAGHTSSPAVCDWNKDGQPELLVGSESGRIYHLAQKDAREFTAEDLGEGLSGIELAENDEFVVTEEFVFTKPPHPECHASSIAITPRGKVAVWFGGTKEKNPDVGVWSSYNDGSKWTGPKELANGVQEDGTRYPTWNPVLYYDDRGVLQLYYKVGPHPREWWGMLMESMDGGRTWQEPHRLPDGVIGPVKNKPVKIGDALYCPSSTEHDGWQVHFDVTRDHGKTWTKVGPINTQEEANGIQPSILKHGGDKLQILARNRKGKLLSSFSEDAGKTWGPLEETELPNPNSGTDAVTLEDGRHLLIYNHVPPIDGRWGGLRSPLNLAVSEDGLNWSAVMVLEVEPGEYSYPSIIQGPDGLVHMSWTWKRDRVKHVTIDPEQITSTPIVDGTWPESVK